MARTSNRRWKGCPVCHPSKDARLGDAARAPWRVIRQVGKKRRWNRHDIGRDE
jgi:hypothetical protein